MVEISPIFNNFSPPKPVEKIGSASLHNKEEALVGQEKKQKSHGATIAFSLIGVAIISTLFFKGNKGTISKHLDKTRLMMYKDRNKRLMKPSYNILDKLVITAQKVIDKGIKVCNSISNIMPVKDIVILNILNCSKTTMDFTKKINKIFRNTAITSSKKTYDKAFEKFNQIHSYILMITKNMGATRLQEMLYDAESTYHEHFLAYPHNARINKIHKSVTNLDKRVGNALYDNNNEAFNKVPRFNSYITFDLIEEDKKKYYKYLLNIRKSLTMEPHHKITEFYDNLNKIRGSINVEDMTSMNLIKNITTDINQYKSTLHNGNKKAEFQIADKFMETLKDLQLHLQSYSGGYQLYTQKQQKEILECTNNLYELLGYRENAILQNCLASIETVFGRDSKEFRKSKQLVHEFSKVIDKGIELEGIGLFEKLAEIKIGSGPNDLMGVALPAIFAAYLTMQAETKDERITTALQTSIPIVGGVAVTIYGTVRMYAGASNLALGLLSALGLNIVGTWINKIYKSYGDMAHEKKLKRNLAG